MRPRSSALIKYASFTLVACVPLLMIFNGLTAEDWRTASREPVGLAPTPASTPQAVVQVYAARAVRWRGYFGVHTWIAAKPANADHYSVYEVNGWRLRRSGSAVVESARAPDSRWFGSEPKLLADVRGDEAQSLIGRLEEAVRSYPYAGEYRVWPGPNSNTFTAYVLRRLPELRVDLPPTAIGKDYLGNRLVAVAPSGTGYQLSLLGAAGLLAATQEGLELNVLGLTFGIDALDFALKLPMIGRLELLPIGSLLLGIAALAASIRLGLLKRRSAADGS